MSTKYSKKDASGENLISRPVIDANKSTKTGTYEGTYEGNDGEIDVETGVSKNHETAATVIPDPEPNKTADDVIPAITGPTINGDDAAPPFTNTETSKETEIGTKKGTEKGTEKGTKKGTDDGIKLNQQVIKKIVSPLYQINYYHLNTF
jgi:hypothetical protein